MAAIKRERKLPKKLEDFHLKDLEDFHLKESKKKSKKLWEVEEVLEERNGEVLVKWTGYDEEYNSWVCLAENPELSCYLVANAGNPCSSRIAREELPVISDDDRELWVVKAALFDELQFRRTPENDSGHSRRVQVKVPFSREAFTAAFAKGTFLLAEERGLDFSGTKNIKFACTAAELASVFGIDSIARQFEDSSTVCEVDPSSKVYVSWGYELRSNYDHSSCSRCTYTGEEDKRPSNCHPKKINLPPMAEIVISFSKRRRNLILNRGK